MNPRVAARRQTAALIICLLSFSLQPSAFPSDRLLVLARQIRTPFIPGLVNWFSAPPRSTFTLSGTTNISGWYDRLNRTLAMGNSVVSNQPALTASSYVHFTKAALDLLDGQGVIDFFSDSPFNPITRPFTFAAIFKPLASAGPAGLLGGRAYIFGLDSQIDWAYLVLGNDLFHQLPNEVGNGAITSTLTGALATNSLTCLVGLIDGTNFTVRINGRYYQQGTTTAHPLTRDPSSDFFTGGFIDNGGGPPQNGAQMDIYEILAGEAMDTAGMLRIERALHALYPSIAFTNYPVLQMSGSLLLAGPEFVGPYPDGTLHLSNLGNGDLSWSTSSTNYNGIAMFKTTPFTGTIAAGASADITLTVLNVNNWFSHVVYGSPMSITNVSNAAGTTNFTVTLEPF